MRRQFTVLASAALSVAALSAGLLVPGSALASSSAAAKHGHERLHAVTHSSRATWVRVSAFGVLKASGHFVPRALAGGRITERMVFKRGSFLVTMDLAGSPSVTVPVPPSCRFAEHLHGTYYIHRGRRRFARASGSGIFHSHINGRFAHHDGTCTGKMVAFRQALTTWGSLRW
jgi:hypothetical protein